MTSANGCGTRSNRRAIPHRFETCGYVAVHNTDADSGMWRISKLDSRHVDGKTTYTIETERQMIYAKAALSLADQLTAVKALRRKAEVTSKEEFKKRAEEAKKQEKQKNDEAKRREKQKNDEAKRQEKQKNDDAKRQERWKKTLAIAKEDKKRAEEAKKRAA